jgi:hypothetical protein
MKLNSNEGLNMTVKEKCPRGRLRSRWHKQAQKYVTQREGRTWETTRKEILYLFVVLFKDYVRSSDYVESRDRII